MRKIEPLANDYIKVYESDIEGKSEYCYTPGICVLKSGRIIATLDHTYPGISPKEKGMIYISDDGEHFRFVGYFPFQHARPFEAGDAVYIIGQAGNVRIIRSDDGGETWSDYHSLTPEDGPGTWHASATNVWYEEDRLYLVMEHQMGADCVSWPVAAIAPVLMRARIGDDLLQRENWTFASEVYFRDAVDQENWMTLACRSIRCPGAAPSIPACRTRPAGTPEPVRPLAGWKRTWCASWIKSITGPTRRGIRSTSLPVRIRGVRAIAPWPR